ncbi:MAG: hypothetical protein KA419_08325 [Acidobacteria bacterium]|nr:hypothetical protein [Acidobacteriota bacterium]
MDESLPDDPARIREMGNRFLDTLLSYWGSLGDNPVHPQAEPGDFEPLSRGAFPETGAGLDELLGEVERVVMPGLTRVASPRYLGMMNPPPALPAIFADMLAAAFNQNCSLWNQSPAGVEVELAVVDELCRLAGLPSRTAFGILVSGGSTANIMALKLARARAMGKQVAEDGLWGLEYPVAVYASEEVHYSFEKGMDFLGMGTRFLRLAPVDDRYRVDPEALRRLMESDCAQGIVPGCVVGIAGSTNTGSIDPLDPLADIAAEFGAWFHVDAAYGGAALLAPGVRGRFDGIGRADSVTLDPHKWFFVPFECAAFLVRSGEDLRSGFATKPHYYMEQKREDGRHTDFYEYGLQGSRNFKALKLWMTLRFLGRRYYAEVVSRNLRFARRLADALRKDPVMQLFHDPDLGIVCFRARPASIKNDEEALDDFNRRIHERIDREGRFWISRTRLGGRALALRVNFQNYRTRAEDVEELLAYLARLVREESDRGSGDGAAGRPEAGAGSRGETQAG